MALKTEVIEVGKFLENFKKKEDVDIMTCRCPPYLYSSFPFFLIFKH